MVGDLDVLVIGGANTDYLVRGTALPRPGTTVVGDEFVESPGGKGLSQAIAAARLGAKVAFVGRVGADGRGDLLLDALHSEGVDVSVARRDFEAPTGVALIMVGKDGEKEILTAPGANARLSVRDVIGADRLIARARVVLLQLEVPEHTVQVAMRLASASGARVVLDPSPAHELPEEMLHEVYLLRPNAHEAQVLTDVLVKDRESASHAARNLLSRGVRAALVGAPGGDLLLCDGREHWFANLDVAAVDATGAGDALIAACAVELARGESVAAAAAFGMAAAACATTRLGGLASLPRRSEVASLLDEQRPTMRWMD